MMGYLVIGIGGALVGIGARMYRDDVDHYSALGVVIATLGAVLVATGWAL
jgi:hypothetical protein